jgi:Flp pilus assembly CpaE family ATPase
MSIPFREGIGLATGERVAPVPRPTASRIVRNLTAMEQAMGFSVLPDHLLRRLARRLRPVALGPGATVLTQGVVGDSLFLLERGACQVGVRTEAGELVAVSTLHETALCGEAAALGEPSAVTVVTKTDCRLLALDVASLRAIVPPAGEAGIALREHLARRVASNGEMSRRVWRDVAAPSGEAAVIAVYGPKGGSGTTTIALNLAAELAKGGSREVLVVDLDLPFTPAALLSGLVPTDSLMRASWAGSLGTLAELRDELLSAVQLHPSGYLLISAVLRIEEPELLTTEQVTTAIRALRGAFRYIVVDLGSSLGEITLSLVDQARHLVLVATPELPSLKACRDVLKLFRESLGIPDERLVLVLNQRSAAPAVQRDTVERTLGLVPAVEVRHDGGRPERAALTGDVLVVTEHKSEIAKAVHTLAALLSDRASNTRAAP